MIGQPVIWISVTAAAAGCSAGNLQLLPEASEACSAIVSSSQAIFYFPPFDTSAALLAADIGRREQRRPTDFYWSVSWEAREQRYGIGYRALNALVVPPAPVPGTQVSFDSVVRKAEISVVDEYSQWAGEGIAMYPEPAVQISVIDGRTVLELHGRRTIRRYLGWRPDSAAFSWRTPAVEEAGCLAVIRYR
jgi:hypothetical protein